MKIFLRTTIATLVLVLAGAWQAGAETVKAGIGAEPYPPFFSLDSSGKWQGWEIDLVTALCAEAKLQCEIVPVPWDGIIPSLLSKKIDVITASLAITDARKKTIDFSDKYYNAPTVVIGQKSAKFDATPEGVSKKVIGVASASIHANYAKKYFAKTAAEVKEYQTLDDALQDLASGRADAVLAHRLAVNTFLTGSKGACCDVKGQVAADPTILGYGMGAGIRKEDTALKEKFNAAIVAVRANGTYDKITKKYFTFDIYGE